MKKKLLILGVMALILAGSVVKGNTEGGSGATCESPLTNTCYNVYQAGKLIATKKGVLHVR